ncbi:methylated-DNA--[protein]-cysteine S-methyltransferase [Methanosphaerula palustris]|uniref:Methylated-DNA/protein-cysteine methyltransferase n=1 Tax=Methanosphaerula palustris (strain ATCC BAA-1556 / DSM 19958 / E1-9c) TaxID=521011 RepID=B8GJG5_METPE|nr:MGMT family protein [Methanosphaerula palustris]ACL17006.1 methylated-DNA/protein-cysteine methyltransferase [Methanosphaerula palustris E1-9c]
MALKEGVDRFQDWSVHVVWEEGSVYRIWFSDEEPSGEIPPLLSRYLHGESVDLNPLSVPGTDGDSLNARIYRAVRQVPYGSTATYGSIAYSVGTGPRVVGQAMKQNRTPLLIPCHRIVAAHGPGGYTPDISIKLALLAMEQRLSCREV